MMRRLVICSFLALGLGSMPAIGDAPAMPPDPGINTAAQGAVNITPFTDEINQKISDEMNKLVKNAGDKPTVSMIRTWLISQNPANASNPYQAAYTNALNNIFLNLLSQDDPSVTVRLNMALVIKGLGGQKANLAPALTKLLDDKSAAVVLVSEKAASAMLPLAILDQAFNNGGARDALLAAIVKSVKDNSDGPLAGFIADEAYRAINPRLWTAGAMPAGGALSALIDANIKLQSARLEIYKTGTPANPDADTYASYLLLTANGWNAMNANPAEQLQAVQNAVNLISWAGQRAGALPANANQELFGAVQAGGYWLGKDGLGGIIQDSQLNTLAAAVHALSPAAPPGAVKQTTDAIFIYLQQNVPAFQNLQAPLDLSAPAPTSAPATQAAP
jgi:hypothetical protein